MGSTDGRSEGREASQGAAASLLSSSSFSLPPPIPICHRWHPQQWTFFFYGYRSARESLPWCPHILPGRLRSWSLLHYLLFLNPQPCRYRHFLAWLNSRLPLPISFNCSLLVEPIICIEFSLFIIFRVFPDFSHYILTDKKVKSI